MGILVTILTNSAWTVTLIMVPYLPYRGGTTGTAYGIMILKALRGATFLGNWRVLLVWTDSEYPEDALTTVAARKHCTLFSSYPINGSPP